MADRRDVEGAIVAALGLPERTVRALTLRLEAGKWPIVEAEIYVDLDSDAITTELRRCQLKPLEDAPTEEHNMSEKVYVLVRGNGEVVEVHEDRGEAMRRQVGDPALKVQEVTLVRVTS